METVLITGAGRGIGLELAKQYAESGRKVIATVRSPEGAAAVAALCSPRLQIVQLDVTDADSIQRLQAAISNLAIDVLINNAGVYIGNQSLDDTDFAAWCRTFEVNTIAPFRVTSAFLPNLRRSSRPRVVSISSNMGALHRERGGVYAYRSSKTALNKVMQGLSVDLKPVGIVVCPVHPGWVRTDMGGMNAEISVEQCARGLLTLIDELSLEKSGRFWTWEGLEHPW